ncbi:MAG: hypothetical protein U0271_45440 [Polyangiaceae bacterium]
MLRTSPLSIGSIVVMAGLAACGGNTASPSGPSSSASSASLTTNSTATATAQSTLSLKAGDPAPSFSLMGSDGKTHKLSDHLGREVVVVAWFPKAFTGG